MNAGGVKKRSPEIALKRNQDCLIAASLLTLPNQPLSKRLRDAECEAFVHDGQHSLENMTSVSDTHCLSDAVTVMMKLVRPWN